MMGFDTEKILSDVPRMRRYAALMCGNDKMLGDQAVELALKDLVVEPDVLFGQNDYRPHLFRVLQQRLVDQSAFTSETIGRGSDEPDGGMSEAKLADDVMGILAEMPVEQRSALLLVVIEKLSYEHVGYVLGTSAAIVQAHPADARCHLQPKPLETSKTA